MAARRAPKKAARPAVKTTIPLLSLAKRLEREVVARVTKSGGFEGVDATALSLIRAIRGE